MIANQWVSVFSGTWLLELTAAAIGRYSRLGEGNIIVGYAVRFSVRGALRISSKVFHSAISGCSICRTEVLHYL